LDALEVSFHPNVYSEAETLSRYVHYAVEPLLGATPWKPPRDYPASDPRACDRYRYCAIERGLRSAGFHSVYRYPFSWELWERTGVRHAHGNCGSPPFSPPWPPILMGIVGAPSDAMPVGLRRVSDVTVRASGAAPAAGAELASARPKGLVPDRVLEDCDDELHGHRTGWPPLTARADLLTAPCSQFDGKPEQCALLTMHPPHSACTLVAPG
jgi:hypothetical protein